jgi:hypothetical protein
MKAETVKAMLPVIIAFAEKRPVQFRDLRPGAFHVPEWITINPDTTEFRLTDDTNPDEWRVAP